MTKRLVMVYGPVMPTKYTSVSCGVEPSENGGLLLTSEVYRTIDSILDDDEAMVARLHELLNYLREK